MVPPRGKCNCKRYIPPTVIRRTDPIHRYVKCQHEFVGYDELTKYLKELSKEHPRNLQLEIIGESKKGKDIYVAIISKHLPYPSLSTIIEAGSNGNELYTVSTALYLIDYMVKTPNSLLLMDYFIVPCLNPDAYDFAVNQQHGKPKKRKRSKKCRLAHQNVDLTCRFPRIDNVAKAHDLTKPYDPEIMSLYRVLERYKLCTRMYISLRENGRYILYPWGCTEHFPKDVSDLKAVAGSGQKRCEDLDIGSIADKYKASEGNVVDYVKFFHCPVKFVYSLHLSTDPKRDKGKILDRGREICDVVRTMSSAVHKHFFKMSADMVFETNIKKVQD